MEFLTLSAQNFRAYEEFTLDASSTGLTLVTGPNNSGKSSLLNALDVVAMLPSETPYGRYGASPIVRARFSLSAEERRKILGRGGDPDEGLITRGDLKWVEWTFAELEGKMRPVQISAPLQQAPVPLAKVYRDSVNYKIDAPGQPIGDWNGTPNPHVGYDVDSVERVLSRPGGIASLGGILKLFTDWQRGYFHFDPLRRSRAREVPLASHERLERDGQNLAEVLIHLQHNDPESWKRLSSLLERIVPNVGELMTPTSQGMFHVAFREMRDGRAFFHNLKDVGAGVEQVLLTLVAGLTSSAQTVVLEEPETGLHPAAQRALLTVIQDWARTKRNFFISTHSTVFLDWSSSDILSVSRDADGARVNPVSNNRAEVLHALGVRLSDALSAERLLVLEGKSDELIMQQWFPELIGNPAVAIIRGEGGDSARHVDILGKWLEQADQIGLRKILYVRDRDELPQRLLDKLEAKETAFLLPCREIENLLLDFDALSAYFAERAGHPLDPVEISEYARNVADGLRQTVVMKRTAWDLEPLRFVDNKLRDRLARRNAGREQIVEAVVSRIPERDSYAEHVRSHWDRNEVAVLDCWDSEWKILTPGFELLNALYRKYLGVSYDKVSDGPILAAKVSPPQSLAEIVKSFIG
ncbi:AAA family ATPase [Streptomyces longwoodensis]|uniref:AAA family ATPase n=1 Tax=Streptomyces longwoodensis TaxID=68231 RepID=UPI0022552C31|nr:AAA family ATPase [Streptomyces longwoodensis]MCX4994309.1 AAA family ATPase [Streptomyces longwoodensis]